MQNLENYMMNSRSNDNMKLYIAGGVAFVLLVVLILVLANNKSNEGYEDLGLNVGEPCKWRSQCNKDFQLVCYKGKCQRGKIDGQICDENNPCYLDHRCIDVNGRDSVNGMCFKNCYYENKDDKTRYSDGRKNSNLEHIVQDSSDQDGFVIPTCTQVQPSYDNCLPENGSPYGCVFRYPKGTSCSIDSECASNNCYKRKCQ